MNRFCDDEAPLWVNVESFKEKGNRPSLVPRSGLLLVVSSNDINPVIDGPHAR